LSVIVCAIVYLLLYYFIPLVLFSMFSVSWFLPSLFLLASSCSHTISHFTFLYLLFLFLSFISSFLLIIFYLFFWC
jgi:hypothetical protein